MPGGRGLKKLTPNQQIFCNEYLIDRNATRAYLKAYPNVKNEQTAGVSAFHLLKNPKIEGAVARALEAQQKRTEITADKTLRECGRIAFSDIRSLFNEDGRLKPIHELDDDTAAAIASTEVVTKNLGEGEVEYVHKIKFWDKNAAINNLGKHFKLFIERKEHTGKDGDPIQVEQTANEDAVKQLVESIMQGAAGIDKSGD